MIKTAKKPQHKDQQQEQQAQAFCMQQFDSLLHNHRIRAENIPNKQKEATPRNKVSTILEELEANIKNNLKHPECHFCPLTLEVMVDPVIFAEGYGHSYERSAIQRWIARQMGQEGVVTDPITRRQVTERLVSNYALKNSIEACNKLIENFNCLLAKLTQFSQPEAPVEAKIIVNTGGVS